MKQLFLTLVLCAASYAQVAEKANERYQTPDGRERVAKSLGSPNRAERLEAKQLVEAMSLTPGMTVVDLGTGVGFMLPHLSKAIGPTGRVLAEDIFVDFLDKAKQKAESEKLSNVEFIQGTETDPKLPEDSVDVVLALDAYHHFNYPEQMLAGIWKSLRRGGKLVLVDFYKDGFRDPEHIRLDEADVIREIEANGFRLVSNRVHVPEKQYMLILEKSAAGSGE
jgi:ubiquinone/menaquinone biosynthesis C-methylase UbiE